MGRAPCCEKIGMKKGRWTAEEDELLAKHIAVHGEGSWRSLPKNAGLLRCGKSCRLRWINYLRSDLKRGNITPEEEDMIIKLHSSLGNRWSVIAGHLPGRTDNEIKNYWNSHLKKRIRSSDIDGGGDHSRPVELVDRKGGRPRKAAAATEKKVNTNKSDEHWHDRSAQSDDGRESMVIDSVPNPDPQQQTSSVTLGRRYDHTAASDGSKADKILNLDNPLLLRTGSQVQHDLQEVTVTCDPPVLAHNKGETATKASSGSSNPIFWASPRKESSGDNNVDCGGDGGDGELVVALNGEGSASEDEVLKWLDDWEILEQYKLWDEIDSMVSELSTPWAAAAAEGSSSTAAAEEGTLDGWLSDVVVDEI